MALLLLGVLLNFFSRGVIAGLFLETAVNVKSGTPPTQPGHIALKGAPSCVETVYSVGVNDGPPGKFVLPDCGADKVEERPCVFKGESYKEGVMKFQCGSDGQWAFTGHTCKGRADVTDQCKYTTHTFTLHGWPGKFRLPLSNPGTAEERRCIFTNERYLKGRIRFVCSSGKWRQDSYDCRHPASGACPPVKFAFNLAGQKVVFDLPGGDNATTLAKKCTFSEKSYAQGLVKFACRDGDWKFTDHTCSDTPIGGCAAMQFTLKLDGHEGVFRLPNIINGTKKEWPCKLSGKTYDKGVVKFQCASGKWDYTGHSCSDQKKGA